MTRINPEDPKWTAYVLGELDDAERAAVELELEASEEARTLVEELRFAVQLTKTELREAIAVTPLTEQQRDAINASAEARQTRRWFRMPRAVWATGLAAASIAVLILTVTVVPLFRRLDIQGVSTPTALKADVSKDNALSDRKETSVERAQVNSVAVAATAVSAESMRKTVPGSGRMFGVVKDEAGGVLPGASVVALNIQTGMSTTAMTNNAGAYAFEKLQPGTYRLAVELTGFRTSVTDGIQLAANTDTQQDMVLHIMQVAAAVEVTADGLVPAVGRAAAPAIEPNSFRERLQGQQGQQGQQPQQGRLSVETQVLRAALPPPPAARAPGVPPSFDRPFGRINGNEAYDGVTDNPFLTVAQNQLSTFSIDVDTASYSNVRRFLNQNQRPPRDAVRIEELINYFNYDYPEPVGNNPIGAAIEAGSAPWNPQHRLVRVAIKARDIEARRRPPSNLVFLLDVSGSMQPQERLPLLKDGLRMLVEQLTANDRVTIVTYAGTTGVALRPTRGDQKDAIQGLIDSLQAGGSTNGASGIQLAYEQAAANFITGGVNRVILATDGDFNVGITDRNALLRLIEDKAKSGIFLSVLGVGMGNYKDATLEMLADKGHGNYAYIDTLNEARKVLVEQMSGTLITVAKDVKVQVEFNPGVVDAYRLIGYENRALRNEDFNNDLKDAGDMGAGQTVTVLYEVVPRGVAINGPGVDPLKYQQPAPAPASAPNVSNETLTVKIRYKEPAASDSKLLVFPLVDREQTFARPSVDFRFAAAVASFGMILRESPYKGTATFDSVMSIAEDSLGADRNGYRREFLQLVGRARQLRTR